MLRLNVGLLVIAIAAVGCGGDEKTRARGGKPAATTSEQRAVQAVAFGFWQAFENADAPTMCGLMAPRLRAELRRALVSARPRLRGRSCGGLFLAAYRDPGDQPPATKEAHEAQFKETRVNGNRATLTFDDGHAWRLEKAAGRWRITAFPILPPSIAGGASGGSLS